MKLGERRSLRILTLRWIGIFVMTCVLGGLSAARYYREVSALSPEQLMMRPPAKTVRVFGRVKAGTLHRVPEGETFELFGESGASLLVRYVGPPDDNLRDLKGMVVEGEWDRNKAEFFSKRLHLPSHYRFVMAAYLLSLLPLGFFLFFMERKVILLSLQIKEAKTYDPSQM